MVFVITDSTIHLGIYIFPLCYGESYHIFANLEGRNMVSVQEEIIEPNPADNISMRKNTKITLSKRESAYLEQF
jgi:hypothetical protein